MGRTDSQEPAFPVEYERETLEGLTKREFFAIKMAAAIRAVGEWEPAEEVASMAVQDADALIKELNETS